MSLVYILSPYRLLMNMRIRSFARTVTSGKNILEVGSGPISYKSLFPNSKVISVDIVKTPSVDDVADITRLKYKSTKFDLILCFNVLEHVYDVHKAVSEMYRVLKTGGCVALIVPFLYPIHDPPIDFYRFTEYSLKNMFAEFSDVVVEPVVILPFWLFRRFVLFYFVVATK